MGGVLPRARPGAVGGRDRPESRSPAAERAQGRAAARSAALEDVEKVLIRS